jgi:hypothetical protein
MTPLLDTIIGLVFVFLIFSLITSWSVEYISLRWNRRGDMLYKYLTRILDDHLNLNLGVQLYHHPLILQLSREADRTNLFSRLFRTTNMRFLRRLPMYIPSEQFAAALIDAVAAFDEKILFKKETEGEYALATKPDVQGNRFQKFQNGVAAMRESDLKRTLTVFIQKANAYKVDPVKMDETLEQIIINWFENGMDRMSGWYKRATRKYLLITGLLAAILFNVDTVKVVKTLWADPKTRNLTAEAATQFVKDNPDLKKFTLPSSLDISTMDSTAKSKLTPEQTRRKRDSALAWVSFKIDSAFREMQALGLPVGWSNEMAAYNLEKSVKSGEDVSKPTNVLSKPWKIFPLIGRFWHDHLLGWILTAFALSFGSAFWFDVLKKFVNMRSAGLKPKPMAAPLQTK